MEAAHLEHLADEMHEFAEGCRWLAGLAGASGSFSKAADVNAKAEIIDASVLFLREVAGHLADAPVVEDPADHPDVPEVEHEDDHEDE